MGVLSDAAATLLAQAGHGTLAVDVWSDFQPADPDLVTMCRDDEGQAAGQAFAGVPAAVYGVVQVMCRGPKGDPVTAQNRALNAFRILAALVDAEVTPGGMRVTFNGRHLPRYLDDDELDRPRFVTNFNACATNY